MHEENQISWLVYTAFVSHGTFIATVSDLTEFFLIVGFLSQWKKPKMTKLPSALLFTRISKLDKLTVYL